MTETKQELPSRLLVFCYLIFQIREFVRSFGWSSRGLWGILSSASRRAFVDGFLFLNQKFTQSRKDESTVKIFNQNFASFFVSLMRSVSRLNRGFCFFFCCFLALVNSSVLFASLFVLFFVFSPLFVFSIFCSIFNAISTLNCTFCHFACYSCFLCCCCCFCCFCFCFCIALIYTKFTHTNTSTSNGDRKQTETKYVHNFQRSRSLRCEHKFKLLLLLAAIAVIVSAAGSFKSNRIGASSSRSCCPARRRGSGHGI